MNWPWLPRINLGGAGRIAHADVERQTRTAQEILRRFSNQPGVVLADEVGMGKTFVALAVACSVVEATQGGQVVILVPTSVGEKWPREWTVFRDKCLGGSTRFRATQASVSSASDFLKKLDDPLNKRSHIIFATHTAFSGQLRDPFVRLAVVARVLRRGSLEGQRLAFPRWAASLIDSQFRDEDLVARLLAKPSHLWKSIWNESAPDKEEDDPVPQKMLEAMEGLRFDVLARELAGVPLRYSKNVDERVKSVRSAIRSAIEEVWRESLKRLNVDLPLLILDEAHHLKNPDTRLARLLSNPEGDDDSTEKGVLAGMFRRMLFLSATPFQLGHRELVQILHRFEGIRWPKEESRADYRKVVVEIDEALTRAQLGAQRLDQVWGRLVPDDLRAVGDGDWWSRPDDQALPEKLGRIARQIQDTQARMRGAEAALRPWIIRHIRPDRANRRRDLAGRRILDESAPASGLLIDGAAVFPFLLAARAQGVVTAASRTPSKASRALFAEGLASSFEAYRDTRTGREDVLDDVAVEERSSDPTVEWYLERIERALPPTNRHTWGRHPKVSATVNRVVELWDRGEKVVVFCFFRATCKALRSHLSAVLRDRIISRGRARLGASGLNDRAVWEQLERFSKNRFQKGDPLFRTAADLVTEALIEGGLSRDALLAPLGEVEKEGEDSDLLSPILRFFRTPAFLVRSLDLVADDPAAAFRAAWDVPRDGHLSLREEVRRFGRFLESRTEEERAAIRRALSEIQTGTMVSRDSDESPEDGRTVYLPNVRVVNGETKQEARQNLMLAFNTPFFPEILVASSVMAEGVDLHLACRHVIHHDLDWNPSTLEQRTGRLDRLGSKAEVVGQPIVVYQPFLEATQDEKMFRVVKDRERWFNVVLGDGFELDEFSTDRAAERVPLPEAIAGAIGMKLGVDRSS